MKMRNKPTRLEELIDSTIHSLNLVKHESNLRLKAIELRAAKTKIDIIVEHLEELVKESFKTEKGPNTL